MDDAVLGSFQWFGRSGRGDCRVGAGIVLVLTRKARQSIMIGDDIEVTVLSNDGSKVRLGVTAPGNVAVHRTEIWLEIKAEGFESGGSELPARSSRRRRAR